MKAQAVAIFAAIAVTTWANQARATATVFDEMLETTMEAQGDESLFIAHVFGPDGSTTIHFSSTLDPVTGTFSYSTVSGQFYLDQSLSLSMLGTYDPSLRLAEWTTSGQLGSQSWSGIGSVTWTGDPSGKDSYNVKLGGVTYKVTSDLDFEVGPFGLGKSTGKYTFTGPAGGPGGPGPFGPYDGTDQFLNGKWEHEIKVPKNPVVPNGIVILASGQAPFPAGGVGNFQARIVQVSEPPSLLLFGMGAFVGLVYFRRRTVSRGRGS